MSRSIFLKVGNGPSFTTLSGTRQSSIVASVSANAADAAGNTASQTHQVRRSSNLSHCKAGSLGEMVPIQLFARGGLKRECLRDFGLTWPDLRYSARTIMVALVRVEELRPLTFGHGAFVPVTLPPRSSASL